MVGTVSGPAIGLSSTPPPIYMEYRWIYLAESDVGPCIGGLIVTFAHWRIIYWVQVAMAGVGLAVSITFLPDFRIEHKSRAASHPGALEIISMFNPMKIFRMLLYPNVLLAVGSPFFSPFNRLHLIILTRVSQQVTCGLLAWFQYSILTSVRSVFNPRFHLTTALVSGLFYLAPGTGFLVGSIVGGKLSDRTVRRYIQKRNGVRMPQDRLNSGLITLFGVLPVSTLIYGWTLQGGVGGMALPIVCAFFAGAGLMGSFNGLNTYTAGISVYSPVILRYSVMLCMLTGA